MIESISTRILLFCSSNKQLAKLNRNNGAVSAEDFFANLLNLIHKNDNYNLINANSLNKVNYPGIDLLDLDNKRGIQVTVENSLKKIKNTFDVIPRAEDNKDYNKIEFLFQLESVTNGIKKFSSHYNGYEVKTYCLPDILKNITKLNNDILKEVCIFVEDSIEIPDKVIAGKHIDEIAFRILFAALKNKIDNNTPEDKNDIKLIYKSSSKEKKNIFINDWNNLINLYKLSLGIDDKNDNSYINLINYQKNIEECFSQELDEDQKELIIGYLRTESHFLLIKNNSNPIISINELTEKIKKDFDVTFLSKIQVESFILNMFFACDVFPLNIDNHE